MSIQPIHQIKKHDIIMPEQGNTLLYVTGFERDAKNSIINVLGHPILETVRVPSGSQAVPITQSLLKAGSVNSDKLMAVISKDALTSIKVMPDRYYAHYHATASEELVDAIETTEKNIGLGAERVVDIQVSDSAHSRNYSSYMEDRSRIFNDNLPQVEKEDSGESKKKATSVVYRKDMYLETAVKNGILPKDLYDLFANDSKSFTTLHDVFNALNEDNLDRFIDLGKTKQKEMPGTYKPPPVTERAFTKEISRREALLDSDPVIKTSETYSIDYALEQGWIAQTTYDVFTQQVDPEGNMNAESLYDILITVGAHSYYLDEFKNPETNRKLSKALKKSIIEDSQNAYKLLTNSVKQPMFYEKIRNVRSAFFNHVLKDGNDVLDAPDMSKSYTAKTRKKAEIETTVIVSNRPMSLEM